MDFRNFLCALFFSTFFTCGEGHASVDSVNINIDSGLRVSNSTGEDTLLLGGYLLYDLIPIDDNATRHPRTDLFNAWLFLVGTVDRVFFYKIQYSLDDSSGSKLRDGYLGIKLGPEHKVRFGQFDVSTYAEHLSALTYTPLAGRAMVDSLTPGRDVGVQLLGDDSSSGRYHYALGVFNGNGIDSNGEDNGQKDIALRVTGRLIGESDSSGFRFYPDLTVSSGKQNGDQINLRSESGTSFLMAGNLPVDERTRTAVGIYSSFGSWYMRANYLDTRYGFKTSNQSGEASGYSVLLSYYLTGETDLYRGGLFQKTKPRTAYNGGNWGGAWQVVFRFSFLEASNTLRDEVSKLTGSILMASSAEAMSVGVNWIPTGNSRINLSWIDTRYQPTPQSALKNAESVLLLRMTLQFF